MLEWLDGVPVFDYGNNLRAEAQLGGCDRAFDYPGFVPAYIVPSFAKAWAFRWVALSGDPEDIRSPTTVCANCSRTKSRSCVG